MPWEDPSQYPERAEYRNEGIKEWMGTKQKIDEEIEWR